MLLKNIFLLIRLLLFWCLIFTMARVGFVIMNFPALREAGLSQWPLAFFHGFRLDLSISCYLMIIPLLLWIISQWSTDRPWVRFTRSSHDLFFLFLIIIISSIDAVLYRYWGQKLNTYALSFAGFPREMLKFSSGAGTGLLICLASELILGFSLYFYFVKSFVIVSLKGTGAKILAVLWFLISISLLFLGIRGGLGKSTINQSFAYFSNKPILNHTALNASWNLVSGMVEPHYSPGNNPYTFMPGHEADSITASLFHPIPEENYLVIENERPNIVLIILEGWTADVIKPLGGDSDVTPAFNELCKSGYLFTRFYATGNRTDKGLAAILSGQPALPTHSIVNRIEKYTSIPSLASSLSKAGYETGFIYGGESEFANMKAYLLSTGYAKMIDINDFSENEKNAEWGVHDDRLYLKAEQIFRNAKSPFFATILTLSSHEPFSVPHRSKFKGKDDPALYRNAVHFSDSCLGRFIRDVKKESWYKNTLFVLVADHGHRWPYDRKPYEPAKFAIPFLVTGGVLDSAFVGKKNSTYASQVDIPFSLLEQFGIPAQQFHWGRNLFSNHPGFACYIYDDGIGYLSPRGKIVIDHESKKILLKDSNEKVNQIIGKQARAYQQSFTKEYLER